MRVRSWLLLVVFTGVCVGWAATASAQGAISGVVRDRAGKGIDGASVVAENPQSRRTENTTTNRAGRFSFIGLDAGTWLFIIRAPGFEPSQAFGQIRRAGAGQRLSFVLDFDPLHPPTPTTGQLANIEASDLSLQLDAADRLLQERKYGEALEAYEQILARVPTLTTLNLQIGHAHRGQRHYDEALTAYRQLLSSDPDNAEALAAVREVEATPR